MSCFSVFVGSHMKSIMVLLKVGVRVMVMVRVAVVLFSLRVSLQEINVSI